MALALYGYTSSVKARLRFRMKSITRAFYLRLRERLQPRHGPGLTNASQSIDCSIILPKNPAIRFIPGLIRSTMQALDQSWNPEFLLAGHLSESEAKRLRRSCPELRLTGVDDPTELLEEAGGAFVVLLDASSARFEGDLAAALAEMKRRRMGLMALRSVDPGGSLAESGGIILTSAIRLAYGRGDRGDLGRHGYVKEIDCPAPRNLIMDKSAVIAAGGLNHTLGADYQMADLSFRMRAAGWLSFYYPRLVLRDLAFNRIKNRKKPGDKEYFRKTWLGTRSEVPPPEAIFKGRDRSRGQKCLIMVDDRIPAFDQAAGDRNSSQTLALLRELGFNLKFIPGDFARLQPYASLLEDQGIEIVGTDGARNKECLDFLARYGQFIDFVILNRPHPGRRYLPLCRRLTRAKIIYCCQDLHFLRLGREARLTGTAAGLALDELERMELELADAADMVLTPSRLEKEILDSRLQRTPVRVAPIFTYRDFPPIADFSSRRDLLFVGGAAHQPNVDGLHWFCREILPLVHQVLPEINLNIVGRDLDDAWAALQGARVRVWGGVSDQKLAELYQRCRLAVIPIRYGAGVKGKLVEAMYYGLPVVSTGMGLEGLGDLPPGLTGLDCENEFAERVVLLYNNNFELKQEAENNRDYVRRNFSWEKSLDFYRTIFNLLAPGE